MRKHFFNIFLFIINEYSNNKYFNIERISAVAKL